MWKNWDLIRKYIDKHDWVWAFIIIIWWIIILTIIVFLRSVYTNSETPNEWIKNLRDAFELFCIPWCAWLLLSINILLSAVNSKIKK